MRRALVYGFGVTGEATARALTKRGWQVVVADDRPSDTARAAVASMGLEYVVAPGAGELTRLVEGADLVSPSPGVPEHHPVVRTALASGSALRSEIDLAFEWEQQRPGGPRPMLAVTGTDGKTTTTLLTVAMLAAAGVRSVDAGNTDTPLVAAIDGDAEVFVVECTSFRLAWTTVFRPEAAVWLNLAEDHQDWHTSMESYRAAKSRIWRFQRPEDVSIGWATDAQVIAELDASPGRHVTFALQHDEGADYHCRGYGEIDAELVGPAGVIAPVASMARALPHDITNALAAAALVLESGTATETAIETALSSFRAPPHRLQLVAEHDQVRYFNDSKATTPHAVGTALRAFDSVVLIAGGKNKGLDLAPLASEPGRMRAVVAIGASADTVAGLFAGICPVSTAESMVEAVAAARAAARPGDVVLLSPGCASFDWYSGYPERGDDFVRCVTTLVSDSEVRR